MMIKQLAFFLALAGSASAMELTPDNYAAETDGKTVFLKFFAPWCGHCKKMKPDWDKLISDFSGSSTQLIADVDCTADGKPLCDSNGVKGFPSLKWGDASDLQDYQGGRTYEDLKKFADENLKPMCSLKNVDLCSDEKKAQIEKYNSMSIEDLQAAASSEEGKLDEVEATFKAEVQKLQDKYSELSSEKDAKMEELKGSGLGLMKSVIKAKESTAAGGSDEL